MSELPKGWLDVQLSEVAEVIRGVTYKKEQAIDVPKERFLPVLRATNITGSALTFDGLVYVPVESISETQLLRAGDVVIASSSGSKEIVGKAGAFTGGNFVGSFGAFCTGLRPSASLSASYFGFFFQTPSYRKSVSELSSGSNINNLKTSDLASQRFSLPPEAEQTRIVAKLEELLSDLDVGVAELKAAQKKLAQYRQSLLKAAVEGALTAEWREQNTPTETGAQLLERILTERRTRWEAKQLAKFAEQGKTLPKDWQKKYPEPVQPDTSDLPELPEGWVWASVDQLTIVVRGASPRPAGDPRYFGGNIPWITVGSLTADENMFLDKTEQFVTDAGRDASRYIEPHTLLLTNSGATLGVPKITRIAGCINDGSVALLDVNDPLKTYLYWFLRTQTMKLRATNQGAAQPNLNTDIVKRICVPLCPEDEMRFMNDLIGRAIEQIRNQETNIDNSLKQSTAQRQNILRAAFAGELVPQDPNDEPASVLLERIRAERAKLAKQPKKRQPKKQKEIVTMVSKLIDVLAEAGDWLEAQEAFRRCGAGDGAQTERIEELYAELRKLDKSGRLAVEVIKDKKGCKVGDRIKLMEG